jgi:drug/metabolite transporter (DMT)-like permease
LTTVANTLLVGSITPLLTALFARFFLGQKTPARTWIAIVLAFIGVTWIFVGNTAGFEGTHLAGLLFALAVPFAYATNYMIFSKAGKSVDMMPAVFLGGALSSFAMIFPAFPLEASLPDIGILAVLGIFQLGVPCLLLVYVSRFLLPTEMALVAMLEMVLGPLWVWIGMGEIPSWETLTGGSVVLLCLLIHEVVSMRHMKNKGATNLITERKQ